ncbi:OmpA family protein [Shewanella sp. 38A_GOM-205m]|uniref:OmpA family protein n=1 Tax=Shewanella sp. 38A_GOM-205m TaxID=1380363 RepID=UPI00049076B1|nr:OmpA family protein [Shewanella sp. 38A_GOM-205m]
MIKGPVLFLGLSLALGGAVEAKQEDLERSYLQPFVGLKAGYQLASDDAYNHSEPKGGIFGLYGGIKFSKAWSWDLGYQYHDDLEAKVTSINVKTWLAESAIRYDWYIRDNLSFYGRLGVAYWDIEKTVQYSEYIDDTGFSPIGEIGLNYRATPNIRMSIGYKYVDGIGSSSTGKYDSHALLLGVDYVFGGSNKEKIKLKKETDYKEPEVKVIKTTSTKNYTFSEETIGGDYSFGFDSAALSRHFIMRLAEVASTLKSYPQAKVNIVGHTDSSGSDSYNQKLSLRRAQAVASQLHSLGVQESQISVSGKGELMPVASNATPQGRAQNRRVEVIIPSFEYSTK